MFRRLRPGQLVFDIAVPSALFLVLVVPYFSRDGASVIVLAGMCVALAFRRLSPGLALAIAWATAVAQMAMQLSPDPINLLILPVLYATAAYGGNVVRWLGLASVPIGAIVITGYAIVLPAVGPYVLGIKLSPWLPAYSPTLDGLVRSAAAVFVSSLVGFGLAWTVGLLVRTAQRAQASGRAAVQAEQEVAAEQERTRIARDMHDVVAHSLAVVVAQADGARYLGRTDPEATDAALSTIASTAREALSDVRVLLAQLRYSQGDAPQPTLVDLDRLIAQLRAAGLTVAREVTGTPLALGAAQQLAVYRIVQESLTNALRHADTGAEVLLRFAWSIHGLELTISSFLPPTAAKPDVEMPAGHGIAGMTERAALTGGWLTAGPDGDRFVVRSWLPAQQAVTA